MACDVVQDVRGRAADHLEKAEHVHFDGVRAPTAARRYLRLRLGDLPDELVDTAELLTSEVVTNGLLHARTGMTFGMTRTPREVVVMVADGDNAPPTRKGMPSAETLTSCGRGLAIIESLADDFGWSHLPDRAGKVVWFSLRLDGGRRHAQRQPV